MRLGIVEGSDVESGDIGFIGTKDEQEMLAIGKKLRLTMAGDTGGGIQFGDKNGKGDAEGKETLAVKRGRGKGR
jgi:hypothetical protein